MNLAYRVVSIAFVALVYFRACLMCPKLCYCKWKHGKQTAECTEKDLTSIPDDANIGTQVIDVSRNRFKEIVSKAFQKKGLANLQKIYMSENEISSIASDAFFQLSNLVELDLSHNKLQTVPSNAFSHCPNLRRLQLAHNLFTRLENDAFSSLSHLTYLGLGSCQIEYIEQGALNGLENLDVIEFDGNRLNTLSINNLQSLSVLSGLQLHNNPWHCDCKLRELRTWMAKHNIPLSVPPHCESPSHLKGFSWDVLSLEDFACVPKILDNSQEMEVISGHNVSFHCQVNSFPKASIYWDAGGRSLRNISHTLDLKMKYSVKNEDSAHHQSSELTVYNVIKSDNAIYSCVAENKAGTSSINFTLTVVCPDHLNSYWSIAHISFILLGVLFIVILAVIILYLLPYHSVCLIFGSKINLHLPSRKQNTEEISDVHANKEKGLKVVDKQVHHENGYVSDQLTPDLVSKIVDVNNGASLSTSPLSCSHLDADNPALMQGYGAAIEHLPHENDPLHGNVCSEIYLNPCYGKDDVYNYALQAARVDELPDCAVAGNCLPQNDRILNFREVYDWIPLQDDPFRRYPLVTATPTFPPNSDKRYADQVLEGTDV